MRASCASRCERRGQRGAAALVATMLLFFAMVIGALYANRALMSEQRAALDRVRATQAFEAAEAGLDWGLAQLNSPLHIGADCLAVTDPSARSFRERVLPAMDSPGSRAGESTAALGCQRTDTGWRCECAAAGAAAGTAPPSPGPVTAFRLSLAPGPSEGQVRLTSTGCVGADAQCTASPSATAHATARVEVTLGLLPALPVAPVASLTLGQGFDADAAALEVFNTDPRRGIGIHAGGPIAARQVRLHPPAGSPAADMLAGNDPALAELGGQRLFARYFGMGKAGWRHQPGVTHLRCPAECNQTLVAAITDLADPARIWVDGDLTLRGPLALGTPQRPVTLVVEGAARFEGAVDLTGVVYAGSLSWGRTDARGAQLRGAAIAEAGYQGDGAPDFVFDASVLDALRLRAGSYARVSGSWRQL